MIIVRGGGIQIQVEASSGNWVTTDDLDEGGYWLEVVKGKAVKFVMNGATEYSVTK